jgi:hypothetical protein
MFGAGRAMHADAIGRQPVQAVLVADRAPIGRHAFVPAHAGGTAAEQRCGECASGADGEGSRRDAHAAILGKTSFE